MAVAYVHLTISDYTKWRAVFDSHKDLRDKAGFTDVQVYRNADNVKEVIVRGEAADTEKATDGLLGPGNQSRNAGGWRNWASSDSLDVVTGPDAFKRADL